MTEAPAVPSPRHDRTAAAILDAAAHVLAERGTAASMADVAAAAGVGRATLYRYFATRDALLAALAVEAADAAGRRLADAGLAHVSVEEAIGRIVRALVAVGERYAVLVHEQVEAKPEELERQLGTPIRAVFARGVETGVLRDDVPVEVLLSLFGGMLASAIKLVGHRHAGLEDAAAATTAVFLQGARPAGAR